MCGGLRLAGILNTIFKGPTISPSPKVVISDIVTQSKKEALVPKAKITLTYVNAKDIIKHIGDSVIVSTAGKLYSGRLIESNHMTLLNIGGDNPNQDFTVVINSADRAKFGQPEVDLKGKLVSVYGKVVGYKGKPEIIVTEPTQLHEVKTLDQ
jgi:hypothetical protein